MCGCVLWGSLSNRSQSACLQEITGYQNCELEGCLLKFGAEARLPEICLLLTE
jgi:hypothetical protein